mgnify:CR=1 FL=1
MIKVGVTGSNGFIGWHLCRTIELDTNKFELIEFKRDWFNENINLDLFVSKCDIIVHLAGLNRHSEERAIYDTNVKLAVKLVESFKRIGFKGQLIFSSSIQEERNNTFGNSKKVARELFANWASQSNTIFHGLIIPNVFGAFGLPFYNSVISTFCHQLVNNETPKIETDAILNLIYINDLVKKTIDLFHTETNDSVTIAHTDTYKVSEILELLINFKNKYLENGQIPSLNNQFEINLFNTFRSYFNLKSYFPVKYKNNIDERGNFVEIIRLETGGQVSFSTTRKEITRGNHFHTRRIERFCVLEGEASVKIRKVGTDEIKEYKIKGTDSKVIDMPVYYTHNLENIGNTELICCFWMNDILKEQKIDDTYFEKV